MPLELRPKRPEELRLSNGYDPTRIPAQQAFRSSKARVRGYGGAMGGGKSRALCEEAFDLALEYPGIKIVIARLRHTSIVETTKKTMIEEVIPPEMLAICKKKESGGEDWLKLPNGSVFHFIGLEDPVRWFSSQLGPIVFDEAHEIDEDTVLKLMTRQRQRLPSGVLAPDRVMIGFNPENPGHWLQRWFILGAGTTDHGYYKRQLWATGATKPIGDAEFFIAKATDNPFLPENYVDETLGGLPEVLRRRYLEGEWLFTSGSSFFDVDALTDYQRRIQAPKWVGETAGADETLRRGLTGEQRRDQSFDGKIRIRPGTGGSLLVWKPPVRERFENGKVLPEHRYVVTVDASSGAATDFGAVQVIDIDTFEQVAEYQAKVDPDLLAVEAYRLGMVYNVATVAPEITGGWGFTIVSELKRLRYPRLYTRRVRDRLSDQFTDKLGWDTNSRTRMTMLDTLERVLREREFGLYSERSLAELVTFVRDEKGRPAAQPGCNDDLVITLAIAVTIRDQLPRQIRRVKEQPAEPAYAATGW
jgi:hypothetical protein